MSDLISRSALKKAMKAALLYGIFASDSSREAKQLNKGFKLIDEVLDDQPTIDAAPVVHARWVYEQRYGDSGKWVWRCSACGIEAISPLISALHYCNHCGAIMDGGAP